MRRAIGPRVLLLAVLLLGSLVQPARAQSLSIRFDSLSVEDGLSQSTVRAILQDSRGFMWFGTDDGLNKYDGYTFTLYKHDPENPASLVDNTITALFQDSQGDLWVGTSNGLDRFNHRNETFSHFSAAPDRPASLAAAAISAIVEDTRGNVWVASAENGLNRFNRASRSFTRYRHDPAAPNSLASDSINTLLADARGGIWIGSQAGLDYLNPESSQFSHYRNDPRNPASLSDNHVLALFQDRMGTLWVGTEEGGLNRFNRAGESFTRYQYRPNNPYALSSNLVRAIYEDQSGHLWVGGREGLNLFNRTDEYFSHYQHDPNDPHSLSNDSILSIYADRSGVVWMGTFGGGLSKYVQNNERFALYQHRPGSQSSLSNDVVYALYEDQESVVWVGTMDGGLNRLDPEAGTFSAYQHNPNDPASLSNNDVRAIFEDRRGNLWVGTYGGGLNRLNRDSGQFTRFVHNEENPRSLADNRVMAIYEDRRGNLWVGTRGAGLELMDRDRGQFTHFRHDPQDPASLSGDFVRTIYEDRGGRLWVGTYNGVNILDPTTRTFTRYQHQAEDLSSLSDDRVLSILESADGALWIGTLLGGINRFDPLSNTFRHYTQKQGLPGDAVYGIQADRAGNLWLSTNRGLSRFEPNNETFRNYDRRDGLQSYEYNPGASFQNNRGRIYFGGIQGFNAFDPAQVKDNSLAPGVVITAFKKFNQVERKDLLDGERITLSYLDNFVSFEFAALDYSAPEKNQYAYKLEGFDKDWIYSGTRRYASYTNLRGGTYVFRVVGSNKDGTWNENGASVAIVVTPPFWESWWFIGATVLLAAGVVMAGYRIRLMQVQAQTRHLEEQVHERTQEIERRRAVAEGLREILAILNSNRSLKESLDAIVAQMVQIMGAQGVVIFRREDQGAPGVIATNLPGYGAQSHGQAIPAWLTRPVLDGQRLLLPDLPERRAMRPELDTALFRQYAALMAVPLMVSDKVDGGVLLLYRQTRVFYEEDIQMAMSFADHSALAIANALLRSQAEEIAVSAERSRLARDLHDAVTQTLFATSLIAEVLPRLWQRNPELGMQKVHEIRELTRGALAEMRTLLMELRPSALADVPLPDLLQQLSEAFTGRARIPVALALERPVELPVAAKIGFYRIAQEALNNIQKHARATRVEIHLHETAEQVVLSICDDGVGFEPSRSTSNHFGLRIMEERAQAVGAALQVTSEPGCGVQISVSWAEE